MGSIISRFIKTITILSSLGLLQPVIGQTQEFTFGNSYYEVGQLRGNWDDAASLAASRGGKLLTIESQAENDFIIENFWDHENPGRIMLGITDIDTEGTWRNQDGEIVYIQGQGEHRYGYTNWRNGRADNFSGEGQLEQADWGSIQDMYGTWDTTWYNGAGYWNGEAWVGGRTIYVFEYPIVEDPSNPVLLQSGSVTVEQDSASQWYDVFFTQRMDNPIVVMGPVSNNGVQAAFARVRNVTDEGFEYQIDEWDFLDGSHIEESVHWLAVESGVHTLDNGHMIEAGSLMASTVQTNHSFAAQFNSAPAVFGQVASSIDSGAVVARIDDVTAFGFDFLMQEEEASFLAPVNALIPDNGSALYDEFNVLFPSLDERAFGVHSEEIFNYIALSQGNYGSMLAGSSDGIQQDTHEPTFLDFSTTSFNVSGLLLQTTSMDAYNPATGRLDVLNNNSATVFFQEETSYDPETTRRAGDSFSWLAMQQNASITIGTSTGGFVPDPNKVYHIDNPALGLRLAALSGSEELESRTFASTGVNTQWQFVQSPTPGLWHIQRATGGSTPRIRTDLTTSPDMQATSSAGTWTQFSITANPDNPGTYLITAPLANTENQRLRIRANGNTDFATNNNTADWPSFIFVEAN